MRSFAVLLSLLLMGVQAPAFATDSVKDAYAAKALLSTSYSDSDILFKVTLPKTAQQSFDAALLAAMRIELIRLSGNRSILQKPEGKYFLDNPKLWLKNYGYKPQVVEGVVVGQNIYFEFAEQRIYQQFQKSGLQVWPYSKRPKVLIMMSENLGGAQTRFTQTALDYRADVDFRAVAEEVALPIRIPATESDWLLPDSDLNAAMLQEIMQQKNDSFLLVLNLHQTQNDSAQLYWFLYNSKLEKLDQKVIRLTLNRTLNQELSDTVIDLFERLSQPYLNSSTVLGLFSLEVAGLQRFEDFKKLEDFLLLQKPQFRQVKLLELTNGVAKFDIEYQGEYGSVIRSLGLLKPLSVNDQGKSSLVKALWGIKEPLVAPLELEKTLSE